MKDQKRAENPSPDNFEGGVEVGRSPEELDALEGYAVIIQETLEAASEGQEGLQVPGYKEYKRDYLNAYNQS